MKRIGIAGLGKMGSSIARRLLDCGYDVYVWNRTPAAGEELAAAGAIVCPSVETLVAGVEAVIAMLWDDAVAREITLGRVIPATQNGQLVIESSTLSPQMYQTLAEAAQKRGVDFLACPVVGSITEARSGKLVVLPGGTQAAFERGRELLGALGDTVTFTASPLASGYLKLASNSVLGIVAESIGELLHVAQRAGVDRALTIEAVARAFERVAGKKTALLERDSTPRFSASALLKDLRLAKAADASVDAPSEILNCVLPSFERAVAEGLGDRDYIVVALEGEHDRTAAVTN